MFSQKILISTLVVGCCAIPASASLTTYCNFGSACSTTGSAFAAATAADTFQNINVTAGSLGDSYTDLGLDFTDSVALSGTTQPSGWPAGTTITTTNTAASTINITLPTAVNAIDFYVGLQDFNTFQISVTDSNGAHFTYGAFNQSSSAPLFFGITTDSTFSSFSITSFASVDRVTLDDISVGSPADAQTPEVATLLLVATGLFLMGYFRRSLPRPAASQAARRGTVSTISTGITPA